MHRWALSGCHRPRWVAEEELSTQPEQAKTIAWRRAIRRIPYPEEQARITEIQYLLIDRFVAHKRAIDRGTEHREGTQQEVDDLLREKRDIEAWAVVGSA